MKKKYKYAVLVSGRGSNLKAILEAVQRGEISSLPALVVTDNPSAPALAFALKHGAETCFINPEKYRGRKKFAEALIEELGKRGIDIVCLAGFMKIIHENVIREFAGRIINIHPSLLPAFRGLDAQKQALEAGVDESGCTVHFVDAGMDTGPIIRQRRVRVEKDDTVESLSARILEQEHRLYPQVIAELLEDRVRLENGRVLFEEEKNENCPKPGGDMASACLVGVRCRWDGRTRTDPDLFEKFSNGFITPFCPELLGGFGIPRPRLTVENGDGRAVLEGRGSVLSETGENVTDKVVEGARKSLALAELVSPSVIYLNARSPSCGVSDEGITGVTAALLMQNGFAVKEVD